MAGNAFKLTDKQVEQQVLMAGPAMSVAAGGGARSAKTFGFCRGIAVRAMKAPGSRHLAARLRFNATIQSLWHDTFPKVMKLCFPDVQVRQDKAQWYWQFPNDSQIWFGGLDERERTEKILGNEYVTIFLNAASQVTYQHYTLITTRLAQNCGRRLLAVYGDRARPIPKHGRG